MDNQVGPANQDNANPKPGPKKNKLHGVLMLLCCLLPIAALAFFNYRGGLGGIVGKAVPYLIILLCPLSHLLMMAFMRGDKEKCH